MRFQAIILIVVIILSLALFRATRLPEHNEVSQNGLRIARDGQQYPSITISTQKDTISVEPRKENTTIPSDSISVPHLETSAVETSATQSTTSSCLIQAPLYGVYDIGAGRVVFGQDVDHRWPIASITKLMTAIVASKYMDGDLLISITDEDQENTEVVGSSYTARDLIKAALVVSSNDATYALARSFGYDAFINRMNEEARMLGMSETSFFDPSGLSYLNQSTLSDLSSLMGYLYRSHNSLLEITRQKAVSIFDQTHKKTITLSNIDYFAGEKDFLGGKTGRITQSGENLITLFSYDDAVWMVGVLGSADRFGDIRTLLRCAKNSD
jgi:D-alanyl-D-alanine endopeptidase (penicillin-binding protein 7)